MTLKSLGMIRDALQQGGEHDHRSHPGDVMWRETGAVEAIHEETEELRGSRISRGLFRKFSLKVIEWIRKSLELGRNEVCEVCLCIYLNLYVYVVSSYRGDLSSNKYAAQSSPP